MDPDLSPLADRLADEGLDGYLVDADSESSSNQRYLSGFDAGDPFVTLYAPPETALLVGSMEYTRAQGESRADAVRRWDDYDLRDRVEDIGQEDAVRDVLAAFLDEFGVESVLVPRRFPVWTADGLRDRGVTVQPDYDGVLEDVRAVKTDAEVEWIRASQRANEAAMAVAEDLIAGASVEGGTLHHDGDVLTSERVKREIEMELLRHGCSLDETIVACGPDGAIPHDRGSGPLRADEPIIVDIFPRDKETRYYADMTRTFVNGDPPAVVREFHDLTLDAMDAAYDVLAAGVTGEAVDDAVCDVYEAAGYETIRSNPTIDAGFTHSTGHGVGLDVHEDPRLAQRFDDELEAGNVVTVEPGLYDPDVGGVRVEDLVVVTGDGYENLTDYPKHLAV
jgi:Xaa-Pro aminopeptidase